MAVLLTLLGMLGRLSLFATLLAIPREGRLAIASAIVSAIATALSAVIRGRIVARETERAWGELLGGLRGQDLPALQVHRDTPDGLATIVYAPHEVARLRGTLVPGLVAQAATLAVVVVYAVIRLPLGWLLVGALLGLPLALASRLTSRAQVRAQERSVGELATVDRDVRAIVEAALELRAHAADGALAGEALRAAATAARYERRVYELGASFALLPSAVALMVAIVPERWIADLGERAGWLDVGVIAVTTFTLALGLASSFEALAHATPYRDAFRRVAAKGRGAVETPASGEPVVALDLDHVSLRYPGAPADTPSGLDLQLARGGVVLVGPNGCGKSSTILMALGFVAPTSGAVRVNGEPLTQARAAWLRSRVAYVPQRSYVAPTESLAWHATLGGATDLERLREACRALGLSHRLGDTGRELDTRMGALSGGERQRFLIARALARRADVLILDEPEIGLDARGREELRSILAAEAAERIVLLVAHDAGVAPKTFRRVAPTPRAPASSRRC